MTMVGILQMDKPVEPAEVCKDEDCLFISSYGAVYGVRQLLQNSTGGTYWYHHAWGINHLKDAIDLCDSINGKTSPYAAT
jgi:hypothetical protein